jgi:hypothetical protein
VTVDGYPVVGEDGHTCGVGGSKVTIRDPAGAVVQQVMTSGAPSGRPVTRTRMGSGSPGFPASEPEATPPTRKVHDTRS